MRSGSLVGSAYHSSAKRPPTKARTRSVIGPPTPTSNWVSQASSYSVSSSSLACAQTAWAICAACKLSAAVSRPYAEQKLRPIEHENRPSPLSPPHSSTVSKARMYGLFSELNTLPPKCL